MLALIAGLSAVTATSASAQQSGTAGSQVIVDYSVLESLGPTPTLPELLQSGTPVGSGSVIVYDPFGPPGVYPPAPGSQPTASQPIELHFPAPEPQKIAKTKAPQAPAAPIATVPVKKPLAPATTAAARAEPASEKTAPAPADQAARPVPQSSIAAPTPLIATAKPAKVVEAEPVTTNQAAPTGASAAATAEEARRAATAEAPEKDPDKAPNKPTDETPVSDASTRPSGSMPTAVPSAPGATPADRDAQLAALPPPAAIDELTRIPFLEGSADLPDAGRTVLDRLAEALARDESVRVQLLAFARGTAETESRARRMSLSRALAVRAYLIKQGVRSTRMDVRALGRNVEGEPADRVDIIPQSQ